MQKPREEMFRLVSNVKSKRIMILSTKYKKAQAPLT